MTNEAVTRVPQAVTKLCFHLFFSSARVVPGEITQVALIALGGVSASLPAPPPPPPPSATCSAATCGNQGCLDIYQPSGDHHHIITSSSDSSLTITYGAGDTLGGSHPHSPWTCTCTGTSCPRLVGSFTCDGPFYGSASLNIGLSNGFYTFEPSWRPPGDLVVFTCELSPSPN